MKCLYSGICKDFEHEKIICCFVYTSCKQYKQHRQEAVEDSERKISRGKERKEPLNVGSLL